MIYPQKISAKKTDLIFKILISASIFLGIVLFIINKLTTPNLHWAALANSGIIYIWVTIIYAMNKNINIAAHVMIQTIAILILNIYIDYKLGFKGWSLDISTPIIIIISNITMLVLTIVSHRKFIRYAIYQLIIVLISMLPIFFVYEGMIQSKTLSYIATGISILNLLLTLCLSARDVKEAVIRKFHI